ncbi:hypothetical protein P168DRAFT_10095 [Aspergillus campestris IBT 28561]|uniref:Uncharacterized protein n=1 Tax=Aspergillus campestris (strain IBT 28561) TaxID=1392248 RepID=A0A2I1DE46_ASPC2|nr:uncharacterized protein P168DRAFT_10095 [Aspergillus campestris IBT 28561]PKY08159.1 hypothetical protein P168DRAFT_10095 [Aspergillus campestris IBT 28561]
MGCTRNRTDYGYTYLWKGEGLIEWEREMREILLISFSYYRPYLLCLFDWFLLLLFVLCCFLYVLVFTFLLHIWQVMLEIQCTRSANWCMIGLNIRVSASPRILVDLLSTGNIDRAY